ncbi:MAG: TatD family hydrolase [Parvularculaceae bacterium]|nr:TatD family hydrolase [Parvularculaceae bacterium]
MLVDSHVNLHHEKFTGEVDAVIESARRAGVGAMLSISDKIGSTSAIREISARYDFIWRSVGAHPHYAGEHRDLTAQTLIEMAAEEDVVGIGECGLDFYYGFSPRVDQEKVFAAHIEAAQETGLPLIIHTREADELMLSTLKRACNKRNFTPLLHCYTGGLKLAEAVMEMGGYISFSGIISFKNADDVRAIARRMPIDRIIVETDCPYLAPVPFRGRRCDPEHVVHVAASLAETLGVSHEEIAEVTTSNFFRLFQRAGFEGNGEHIVDQNIGRNRQGIEK